MKKFSPPQMKEVSFPTPHTPHPLSSQESGESVVWGVSSQQIAFIYSCHFLIPNSHSPLPCSPIPFKQDLVLEV
jgi:hypothetical protein